MKKRKVKYTDEPIGEIKIVKDFLPKPQDLVLKEETVKGTIALTKSSMELEGKVWKDGKFWLVEVPLLDVMTQGRTKKEALMMIRDIILELATCYFPEKVLRDFDVDVTDYEEGVIGLAATNNELLSALSLIRQKEILH